MFDQRFIASKVGAAAMVSIAAMVAFNIFALSYQFEPALQPASLSAALHSVQLA